MTKIIHSVKSAFLIKRGEVITHPVFGKIKVLDIYPKKGDYDLFCELLEYNKTHKVFSAMDMNKIKLKHRVKLRVIQ